VVSDKQRTLFDIRLSDPRERRRVAGGRTRGGARSSHQSSDVRRFGPMAAGAVTALVAVLVTWQLRPGTPTAGKGALALPHSQAALECSQCHQPGEPEDAAGDSCAGCHRGHESRRPGHRALMQRGQLGCVTCHDVHGADQGVRFEAKHGGRAVRYGVGSSRRVEGMSFPSEHDVTVPLIPLERCAQCHRLDEPSDPIGRCMLQSQRDAGGRALNVCFDEHQTWSAVAPPRPDGVCSAQHANDRFAAWEVARQVASQTGTVVSTGSDDAGLVWLAAGGFGAAAGALGWVGLGLMTRRRRARRRERAESPMRVADVVRLPQVDVSTCLGCYACVDACPYDVIEVERYVAVVTQPDACCGLTLCEQVCPNGSLVVTDGDPIGDRLRLGDDLQALDADGIYLAGDVTGLPLIKNAIAQGRQVVERIAAELPDHDQPLDLLIVGAGPAGISAALEAKTRGLRHAVVEQGSVAQSIRSFPRGKLVFAQPLELPTVGKLWLEESTKEELLSKWLRIVREEQLVIFEGQRFEGVTRESGGLSVVTVAGDGSDRSWSYQAARVLLAIGRRGSPRKLAAALSDDTESKVFYHLADARSFIGDRVLVVGAGDVAMETVIAIARQPETVVTVSYRGSGLTRGKSRNIAELSRLVDAGRVELVLDSTVVQIESDQVTLKTPDGERRIANDVVFVMIGSKPSSELLARAGVKTANHQLE